ncbi:putative enzyme related to lactoylglutathione lyase [Kibdelosporangium banguiense]|uniref:Enzyme related to lactoylglutathione lyase n=1 Tax=Kibdelosporangium banguiense TaxID=1365924 RepID=A0ABS4T7A1_9PSEU|nr:VOC family protein [Kibdelosporangium banguiense]MBP2320279.1 putative enzyme related to lactoylglutathione lyase [Kibdelosporangium banguiense]
MSGRVVHFEIPFDDEGRANAFYQEAFGWGLHEVPGYTLAATGPTSDLVPAEPGFINGGLLARDPAATASPVIVIDVPDIEAALTKIEDLGGKTVAGKRAVGTFGFAAYFNDTEGNLMGLWEAA